MKHFKDTFCGAFALWVILAIAFMAVNFPLLFELSKFDTMGSKLFFLSAYALHNFALSAVLAVAFLVVGAIANKKFAFIVFSIATFLAALFLYVDIEVFNLYGYHIDGMVINLIFNPATNDSVDLTFAIYLKIALKIAVFILGYALVIWFAAKKVFAKTPVKFRILAKVAFIAFFALSIVSEKLVYANAVYVGNSAITYTPTVLGPLYLQMTASKLMRKLGFKENKNKVSLNASNFKNYPRHIIEIPQDLKKYNVIVVIIESARAKLNPSEIPNIHKLQSEYVSAKRHYSSGNSTRFGLSGIFYGLYTTQWHELLNARVSPVFFDVFKKLGYSINVFSSTDLNFPEFRQTVFNGLSESEISDKFESESNAGIRDGISLNRLIKSIENDKDTPFCKVVFFNAPHFPYYNSKDTLVYKDAPLAAELNLITDGTSGNPQKMQAYYKRYANAVYYVDTLIGKLVEKLKELGKFNDTILFVVGDHGQEFCEFGIGKGHILHNGCFSRTQTMPLFAAHFPKMGKVVINKITSHYDIPATIFSLMGIKNPESDYSNGESMLKEGNRNAVVISAWSQAAITDGESVVNFGYGAHNIALFRIYDKNYRQTQTLPPDLLREMRTYMQNKTIFNK